jgi:hypothetical protein
MLRRWLGGCSPRPSGPARRSVPGGVGSFEAKVSAVAVNFNGETKRTPQVTITEPL